MEILDHTTCELGEGAFWHPERSEFFWFDILNRRLFCHDGQKTMMRDLQRQGTGEKGAHLSPSPPIAALVQGDTRYPDPKRPGAIVTIECRERGDKALLRQVHGFVGVADMLDDQSVHRRLVATQQLAIRAFVSCAGTRCKVLVAKLR